MNFHFDPAKILFRALYQYYLEIALFIVLIFLLVRDEISEGRASFHRGFDSLDAKILFRVNIIPILFPSYIIYRSNLFIFLEIFRRVKARIRSARDRRERRGGRVGGRVGGRERDKVYRPTNDTDFAPTKISRSGGIRYHERSSYAPLFFFSVCGALVSRGFKRKTLRLFDARFPLPFFPVPGLITRVRQKYTRRRRKGFGGEFSARSSRFDVYLGSRNTSVYLRYNSFFTIFRQVFKSRIYDLHLARNLFIRRYNKESMSSLKYADRVMMFVRDSTMFYRSIKLQILFVDFATNTATEHENFAFSFLFFLEKNSAFFLCDSEDFVEIQSAASSLPSPDSRLRKGGEGEPDFREA